MIGLGSGGHSIFGLPVAVVGVLLGSVNIGEGAAAGGFPALAGALPLHAVAALVVPDKKEALLQSQLLGEVYLSLAYHDLGKHDQASQARDRAEKLLARIEQASLQFDEGQVLWAPRYAAYIAKRELARFSDSPPAADSGEQSIK